MRKVIALIVCGLALVLQSQVLCAQQSDDEQLAAQYYAAGELQQAAEIYEGLYQRTNNKYHYQMLLRTYMALEQYRDAEHLTERRIAKFPKELYLYVDLGNTQLARGDKKKAERTYQKPISLLKTDLRPVPDLAMAFEQAGRLDLALQTYLTARSNTRSKTLYFNEIAALHGRLGDYDKMMLEYFNLLDNSPGSLSSVQLSLQRTLSETSDSRLAEGLRRALISRVQAEPNNRTYLEMMIWFSLQQKDFRFALTQAQAVDARFPDLGGEQVLRVARIAQANADYDVALDAYNSLIAKGQESTQYFEARVGALEVQFLRINNNYAIAKTDLDNLNTLYINAFDELGKNIRTVPLMRNYSKLMAYYANQPQPAADILYDALEVPRLPDRTRDEIKLELADLLLFAGEVWDASLLYMQVEKANKNDLLGAQAKFKNAKLSYYNHDFGWAKSQLDVLRASTSKLIANDAMELSLQISDNMEDDSTYGMLEIFADADLLLYRNLLDSAWTTFDLIPKRSLSHPLLDDVLMKKAVIRMKQARYVEADSLLSQLVDFYPDGLLADDAVMRLAEINELHLNNIEQALYYYEKLLIDYPSSLYTDQARKRYNKLKAR
ncbi:MAG: hypothetical protein K5650_04870 [Bacteroidales bacterium]|nr:hypothetical protein [Bacteroidales bacterium]